MTSNGYGQNIRSITFGIKYKRKEVDKHFHSRLIIIHSNIGYLQYQPFLESMSKCHTFIHVTILLLIPENGSMLDVLFLQIESPQTLIFHLIAVSILLGDNRKPTKN